MTVSDELNIHTAKTTEEMPDSTHKAPNTPLTSSAGVHLYMLHRVMSTDNNNMHAS